MASKAVERHKELLEAEEERGGPAWIRTPALIVAILAVCLALVTLLANHATVETLLDQSKANDAWNSYTATLTQRHIDTDISGMLRAIAVGDPNGAELRREATKLDRRVASEHVAALNAQRNKALEYEHERDIAEGQHHAYLYGETGLETAVVLATMSSLLDADLLLWIAVALGGISVVVAAFGTFSEIPLPF